MMLTQPTVDQQNNEGPVDNLTATIGAPIEDRIQSWIAPLAIHVDKDIVGPCPLTVGVPFPEGLLRDADDVVLRDGSSDLMPLQTTTLEKWQDGSVKWLLTDFIVQHLRAGGHKLQLCHHPNRQLLPRPTLQIEQPQQAIRVSTGKHVFELDKATLCPLNSVQIDGRELLDAAGCTIDLIDQRGKLRQGNVNSSHWEVIGPIRSTLLLCGNIAGCRGLHFSCRVCFFADTGIIRLRLTLHNSNRAKHPGGVWDLGDRGSFLLRDFSLKLSFRDVPSVQWTESASGDVRSLAAGDLEIYQDSSGGENWQSRNHVNYKGRVPCQFRGFRVRSNGVDRFGLRAAPSISLTTSTGSVTICVPEFWQQFPKALVIDGRTLAFGLFPQQCGELFELQGGEQKTHTVWLHFGSTTHAGAALQWVHQPPRPIPDAAWCAASEAIPCLLPQFEDDDNRLSHYLAEVVQGPRSLPARREIIDEFGWRNFGDIYADHEAAFYRGSRPVISHYNNQFDSIFGSLLQMLRTGDPEWWQIADPLARHVIDIDIYRTYKDRAAYNGGLFWFTDHYLDAATSTHRCYSRANRPANGGDYGGGPASEHNFTSGLLLYFYLTGDEQARDTVLSLANWVINMDDGRLNLLGILNSEPTGIASRGGASRSTGNSINALLDGWRLTGERRYLAKAEELIRRVAHPTDDVEALDLLDVERRWSYTVFLSSMIRFLQTKIEAGENDAIYAYGRNCLVTYVRWMARNERPYFDQAERLEFPTEAWAAQEFRKANVLRRASAYVDDDLAALMMSRGHELAERAWSDLLRFESRDVARAVAILMVEGTVDQWLRVRRISKAEISQYEFELEKPTAFVPQKQQILNRARSIGGLLCLTLQALNIKRILRFARDRKGSTQ